MDDDLYEWDQEFLRQTGKVVKYLLDPELEKRDAEQARMMQNNFALMLQQQAGLQNQGPSGYNTQNLQNQLGATSGLGGLSGGQHQVNSKWPYWLIPKF